MEKIGSEREQLGRADGEYHATGTERTVSQRTCHGVMGLGWASLVESAVCGSHKQGDRLRLSETSAFCGETVIGCFVLGRRADRGSNNK